MRFARPGHDCVSCSCRKTKQAKKKGAEYVIAPFIPFVVFKCPHCHCRFWRMSISKMFIECIVLLVLAGSAYAYFK